MKINKSQPKIIKGFTIIELLIVVIIIGLLTTITTTNYMTSQAKARDATRKTQVNSIATSIETYYAVKKEFPGKGPTATAYDSSFIASYAGCENVISSDTSLTGGLSLFFIEYSFKPFDRGDACDKRASLIGVYNPDHYKPFPAWIPELSAYLSPFPVDNKYLSSEGKQGNNNDAHKSLLVKNISGATTNQSRTYTYMKLDSGYAIYTKLETGNDKEALDGENEVMCKNAGLNFNVAGKYCYTEASNTPIIPVKITNNNLYLIRR